MLMKASSHLIAVSRIRKLVLRDSGHYLSDACALEIETLLSSIQNGDSTANEDYEFQNREVSILLADLRGFTAISADRSAGEVLRMLNPVLIKMSEIIFKHGGTIDKFMGDSIMALFEDLYQRGNTIILVTHERDIAAHARRAVHLRDGLIESDEVGLIRTMEPLAAS